MNEAKKGATNSTEMVAIPLVKLDNLIAAVEQMKAGKLRPFMYAIQGPDGAAHIDENCVAGDPAALAGEVNGLNDSPDTGYQIVPVYLSAPAQPAPVETIGTHRPFELATKSIRRDWTLDAVHHLISVVDAYVAKHAAPAPATSAQRATITLTGHQLRIALDLINPDGLNDHDQLDDDLTFGVRQHRDDDGTVSTGMCCWNEDTDGVLPLDGEYKATAAAQPVSDAALLSAIRDGVPLQEPVSVAGAMMAQEKARISLSGGTGPLATVFLVNIQAQPWTHTEQTATAYADGFNRGVDWLRSSIIEYADKLPTQAAPEVASVSDSKGGAA